ncbi:hypothetical protein ACFQ5M_13155 [Agrilactobacillus yilanensis]|uniref:DUF2313 domain-containing protein n=1 Tax=Agrilactobacillus yilanensis TaxID=2485997 RepID=A0ABW4J9H5_9LACO|nr:hypothetical protein [Agrilactobacillus yilanensis]
MGKRKRNHRAANGTDSLRADELRRYIEHATFTDLNFLETLIAEQRQNLLAKENAVRFPVYQRLQKKLDIDEQQIRQLIAHQLRTDYSFELTPSFLYEYFQNYPSDAYFDLYTDWQQTIKKLGQLQDKIGEILMIRDKIRHSGFDVVKTRYSQRSLSTYLYLPLEQADAFTIVFGKQYDLNHLNDLLVNYDVSNTETFSVRISDHINGTFYNQGAHQRQSYAKADVNIYI